MSRDGDHVLGVGEPDAGRDPGAAGARAEMDIDHVGLRVLFVEDVDALTWSSAVIGLSTLTVIGTVLPFSTSGGMSSLTLPGLHHGLADDGADRGGHRRRRRLAPVAR